VSFLFSTNNKNDSAVYSVNFFFVCGLNSFTTVLGGVHFFCHYCVCCRIVAMFCEYSSSYRLLILRKRKAISNVVKEEHVASSSQ